ncbi:MAG: CapA family protein, partial [Oscillospiraceae bacterium]|nr:CapA family protein [Oscillospiraceae bacterium]
MRKPLNRMAAMALALLLTLAAALPALTVRADEPQVALTVLFTHDTHDHFYPDAADIGGYGRLATALKNARQSAQHATITVDAGDFSMGSLFQTVYSTDAPELRALGAMGYDVVTLGNHEFDYRPQGLADMLSAAKESGEALPQIVQANYRAPKDPSAQVAVDAMNNYPVTDYTVIERDGMKIAVFGVMGVDSDECAPMSGMKLEPVAEAAKRVVAEIREKENPTFIICLSHTGTEDGKGEDYELAKAVDGI